MSSLAMTVSILSMLGGGMSVNCMPVMNIGDESSTSVSSSVLSDCCKVG